MQAQSSRQPTVLKLQRLQVAPMAPAAETEMPLKTPMRSSGPPTTPFHGAVAPHRQTCSFEPQPRNNRGSTPIYYIHSTYDLTVIILI